jgi:hypothetical protein
MIGRIRFGLSPEPTGVAALVSAGLACVLCCVPLGAADEPGKNKEDEARREEQLKNLKRSVAQYTVARVVLCEGRKRAVVSRDRGFATSG